MMQERKVYLLPADVERMEASAGYLRDKLLLRLLFRLGCRISEALGIAVSDIDFTGDTVTIQHLKIRTNLYCPDCGVRLSKMAKFCPGCSIRVEKVVAQEKEHRRQRTLPVDADTLDSIQEYIDRGGPVSSNGKQLLLGLSRTHAWKIVRDCASKVGLGYLVNPETGKPRGVSPHRFRDAFAIHAIRQDDSGDGLRMLQEHLGHQSIVTTMKYRKIAGEEQREWYERLWNKEGGGQDGK